MDRKSIILKALSKTQGHPLEVQAAMVESYLEIAGDLEGSAPVSASSPVIPSARPQPAPTIMAPAEMPSIPPEAMRVVPSLPSEPKDDGTPKRSFAAMYSYLQENIVKSMDVEMKDGGKVKAVLRLDPIESLKSCRVVALVDGQEGPQATFDIYEAHLDIPGKLDSIRRGVRAQFLPQEEATRMRNRPFHGTDFSRQPFTTVVGPGDAMALPPDAQPAPPSAFRALVGMKLPGER